MKFFSLSSRVFLPFLWLAIVLPLQGQSNLASNVYSWPGLDKDTEKVMLVGNTTHLKHLEIKTVQLVSKKRAKHERVHTGEEELIIVKEGQLKIKMGTTKSILGPGSVALILPGDKHKLSPAGNGPTVYYSMKYQSKKTMSIERGKKAGGSFVVHWEEVAFREHSKGGRRDFFDRPTAMAEDFEMHVTNLNERVQSHAPHTHQVEEIILMIQGNIEMHIDGATPKADVGDFAFIDALIPHAPTNIGKGQAIYFAFQWK